MTRPKLTDAEQKLAKRVSGGGRANAEAMDWVIARREEPSLTLRQFQLRREAEATEESTTETSTG